MSGGGVQSVARAFNLLDELDAAGGVLGVSELADRAALPPSSIHRLLGALVEAGYVRQLPDRRYCLGTRLVRLGGTANSLLGVRARPSLARLAAQLGESVNLALLDGGRVEYVMQVAGSHSMRMFTQVGRRVPVHCTGVGKALLSRLADDEVVRLLDEQGMERVTGTTITEPGVMLDELGRVRERGYATDEGEMEEGVRCVAVPVPAATLLAVSVSAPAGRLDSEREPQVARALRSVAAELEALFAEGAPPDED